VFRKISHDTVSQKFPFVFKDSQNFSAAPRSTDGHEDAPGPADENQNGSAQFEFSILLDRDKQL
jgi:hypothetical protein